MANNSWMKARQTKYAAYTAVYVLIVVAVVGVLNFLTNRYNKTYDTTSSKQFTLSDQTVKIAKNLKQDVTISYWDQPTQFPGGRTICWIAIRTFRRRSMSTIKIWKRTLLRPERRA